MSILFDKIYEILDVKVIDIVCKIIIWIIVDPLVDLYKALFIK
jgi:hypothetical protein